MRPTRHLTAGPLSLKVEGPDIVSLSWGGTEVLARIQVSVRDGEWGTLRGRQTAISVQSENQCTRLRLRGEHGEGAFEWQLNGSAHSDGRFSLDLSGQANSIMDVRRVGLCLLHPWHSMIGAHYEAHRRDRTWQGVIDSAISPQKLDGDALQPMIQAFDRIRLDLQNGIAVELGLTGDLFEMEDQRNWTDASFKTYSTPLRQSTRRHLRPGDSVHQSISVLISGPATQPHPPSEPILRMGGLTDHDFPQVGVSTPPLGENLAGQALTPSHLYTTIDAAHSESLGTTAVATAALGVPIELQILAADPEELQELTSSLADLPLARLIVHPPDGTPSSSELMIAAHTYFDDLRVPIFGGTAGQFSELNRLPPGPGAADAVTLAMTPQTHADDERSMLETLEIQEQIVGQINRMLGNPKVAVTPVTLAHHSPGEHETYDPRVLTAFGAAWTLGSLIRLAQAGIHSVTFHEPLAEMFNPLGAGENLRRVLNWATSLVGLRLMEVHASDPTRVLGSAVSTSSGSVLLVANLTPAPLTARVMAPNTEFAVDLDAYGTRRLELAYEPEPSPE